MIINVDKQQTFYEASAIATSKIHWQMIRLPRELRIHKVVEELIRAGAFLPDDPRAAGAIVREAVAAKANVTTRVTERPG